MDGVARADFERGGLPQDAPVVQADDDVRHDLHAGRAQGGERCLEVRYGPVEMIDLADRLLRADHVHHRRIDAGTFHQFRAPLVEEGRVHGDPQMGKIALQALEDGKISFVLDLIAPVGAAREQEALQILHEHEVTHPLLEHVRRGRRDHRLQDPGLAVIAVERTRPCRHREGGKRVLAAALHLGGGVLLERRRREAYGAEPAAFLRHRLHLGHKPRLEGRLLQLFDCLQSSEPSHRPNIFASADMRQSGLSKSRSSEVSHAVRRTTRRSTNEWVRDVGGQRCNRRESWPITSV
jgi:hypothetical protein